MGFNRKAFDEFLISACCVGLRGPYVLSSGDRTPYHIKFKHLQKRKNMPEFLDFITSYIESQEIEARDGYFIGVPSGATALAVLLSYQIGDGTLVEARKDEVERAEDPHDRWFYGPTERGDQVIFLEDVTVTGKSLKKYVARAREPKVELKVDKAIVLCDRKEIAYKEPPSKEEGEAWGKEADEARASGRILAPPDYKLLSVQQVLEREGVQVYSMTDISTLLARAIKATCPRNIDLMGEFVNYYANHGTALRAFDRDVHINEFDRGRGADKANIRIHEPQNNVVLKSLVEEGLLTIG